MSAARTQEQSASSSRRIWERIGPASILLAACSILPFLLALGNGFVFDDTGLVVENPAVHAPGPALSWSTPYWPSRAENGLYRPWTTFSYWLNERLFGPGPASFHAINLLLHAGCTLLFWSVLRRLFPRRAGSAFFAAFLFAVHPLHAEAVVWVVGRSELFAALWGLAAYRLALAAVGASAAATSAVGAPAIGASAAAASDSRAPDSRWMAPAFASAAAFFLALASKESSLGLILLPLAHALGIANGSAQGNANAGGGAQPRPSAERRRWRVLTALWVLPGVLLALLRLRVLGSLFGLGSVSISDNVLAHVPFWERILTALGFQWILLLRVLVPRGYSADYSYPQIAPSVGWMMAGTTLLALALIAMHRAWRRRDHEVLWGIAFTLAAGILTANLLFPIGTVLAERLAYLPSAGILWIGACLGGRWLARPAHRAQPAQSAQPARNERPARVSPILPRTAWVVALLWSASLIAASAARTRDWKDDRTLFTSATRTSPRSAKIRTDLAVVLSNAGEPERGLEQSALALKLLPNYPPALDAHGAALSLAGKPEEAIPYLVNAARMLKKNGEVYLRLGNAYLDLKRPEAADSAFSAAALSVSPRDSRLLIGRASVQAQRGRWAQSRDLWRAAAAVSPKDARVLGNWAFALWQAGAPDSAEVLYRKVLAENPEDPGAQNDLAWFLAKTGHNAEEGVVLARAAFGRRPDPNTADTLFEALWAAGGCDRVRAWVDSLAGSARDATLAAGLAETFRQRCSAGS